MFSCSNPHGHCGSLITSSKFAQLNKLWFWFVYFKRKIKSYHISGEQLMSEISRIKLMASKLNIQLYQVEIDPKNTFPEEFSRNSTINIELERQTFKFNLKGNFLKVGKFLENYEKTNSPLRVQSCTVSLDSLDPKGVIAQLHFVTYTGLES